LQMDRVSSQNRRNIIVKTVRRSTIIEKKEREKEYQSCCESEERGGKGYKEKRKMFKGPIIPPREKKDSWNKWSEENNGVVSDLFRKSQGGKIKKVKESSRNSIQRGETPVLHGKKRKEKVPKDWRTALRASRKPLKKKKKGKKLLPKKRRLASDQRGGIPICVSSEEKKSLLNMMEKEKMRLTQVRKGGKNYQAYQRGSVGRERSSCAWGKKLRITKRGTAVRLR